MALDEYAYALRAASRDVRRNLSAALAAEAALNVSETLPPGCSTGDEDVNFGLLSLNYAADCVRQGAAPAAAGNKERWRCYVESRTADALEARLRAKMEVVWEAVLDVAVPVVAGDAVTLAIADLTKRDAARNRRAIQKFVKRLEDVVKKADKMAAAVLCCVSRFPTPTEGNR